MNSRKVELSSVTEHVMYNSENNYFVLFLSSYCNILHTFTIDCFLVKKLLIKCLNLLLIFDK